MCSLHNNIMMRTSVKIVGDLSTRKKKLRIQDLVSKFSKIIFVVTGNSSLTVVEVKLSRGKECMIYGNRKIN